MNEHRDGSLPLFLSLCCWLLAITSLCMLALFGWLLRDGLGPDAVESHGWLALTRVLAGVWPLLCEFVLPLALLGCVFYWWDRRRLAREKATRPSWLDADRADENSS